MKEKNVLVVGVFDLFHRGHLELLAKASSHGERLFVIVNGDELTSSYKRKPIFSEDDRLEIVSSISYVHKAVISNSYDVKPYIESYDIDAIVHGDDWPHQDYIRQIMCTDSYIVSKNIQMIYTPYYRGISTSGIINMIRESQCISA